jgi:hypothetical protein
MLKWLNHLIFLNKESRNIQNIRNLAAVDKGKKHEQKSAKFLTTTKLILAHSRNLIVTTNIERNITQG